MVSELTALHFPLDEHVDRLRVVVVLQQQLVARSPAHAATRNSPLSATACHAHREPDANATSMLAQSVQMTWNWKT